MKLHAFLVFRPLSALLMLFILLSILFFILHVLPGDPAAVLLPIDAPKEALMKLRSELGLDKPLYIQYFSFIYDVFSLRMGTSVRSWMSGRVVLSDVLNALPTTIELTIGGMITGCTLGVVLGLISAYKHNSLTDHLIRGISVAGYTLPVYLIGPLLQISLGLTLGIFPVQGRFSPGITLNRITGFAILDSILTVNVPALISGLQHLVLPSLTLGFYTLATITRISRQETIFCLNQDYVRTARGKGLTERVVLIKHAFRNALIPVVTVMGIQTATLLGGAIITESIFNLGGMGSLLLLAVQSRDFPLIQACIVFSAIWVSVATVLMDLVYFLLDPRVR